MNDSKDLFEMLWDDGTYSIEISDGSQFFQKNPLLCQMNNLGPNLPRILQASL